MHAQSHKHPYTDTKPKPHEGDLNYLKPLIAGPHTQTRRVDEAMT